MELAAERFSDEDLQEERWNPLDWVYLLGDGLFLLLSREFAPLADRLASVAGRLEGMPALLDGARAALVGTDDGRPVGRFQTETALDAAARRRRAHRRGPRRRGRGGRRPGRRGRPAAAGCGGRGSPGRR